MYSRGQMGAPFELLVAVIVMAFALVVGSTILTQVNQNVCINNVEKEMDFFIASLEETANMKTTNKVSFIPEGVCFNQSEHIMEIQRHRDPVYCKNNCGEEQATCYVMVFQASDVPNAFKAKCLNIPSFTNFREDGDQDICLPGVGHSSDNYQVIGEGEKLPFATYTLKNIDIPGESWTNLCVIRQR